MLCLEHWGISSGLRAHSCRYWLHCMRHYVGGKTWCLPGVAAVSVRDFPSKIFFKLNRITDCLHSAISHTLLLFIKSQENRIRIYIYIYNVPKNFELIAFFLYIKWKPSLRSFSHFSCRPASLNFARPYRHLLTGSSATTLFTPNHILVPAPTRFDV